MITLMLIINTIMIALILLIPYLTLTHDEMTRYEQHFEDWHTMHTSNITHTSTHTPEEEKPVFKTVIKYIMHTYTHAHTNTKPELMTSWDAVIQLLMYLITTPLIMAGECTVHIGHTMLRGYTQARHMHLSMMQAQYTRASDQAKDITPKCKIKDMGHISTGMEGSVVRVRSNDRYTLV